MTNAPQMYSYLMIIVVFNMVMMFASSTSAILLSLCLFSKNPAPKVKIMLAISQALSLLTAVPLVYMILSQPPASAWQLNQNLLGLWPNTLCYTHATIVTPIVIMTLRHALETWFCLMRQHKLFTFYMAISLLSIIVIFYAKNLPVMFVAWQTLMAMTLLLPNLIYTQKNTRATLITYFCNQMGGAGFMLTYFYWMTDGRKSISPPNPLEPSEQPDPAYHLPTSIFPDFLEFPEVYYLPLPTPIFLFFFLAMATGPIHLSLHRGLVMASNIPTPLLTVFHTVLIMAPSALLLFRFHLILTKSQTTVTICLCFGAIIMLLSAARTLVQSNIDNIINYPTAGQLGLTMLATGLNLPHLALFYACIHMLVKTMLSCYSSQLMHPSGEKDIRNLELQHTTPAIAMSLGSLILILAPAIIPLYFKNSLILVASSSYINLVALLLALTATIFTAIYNTRLIYTLAQPILKSYKITKGRPIRIEIPFMWLTISFALPHLQTPEPAHDSKDNRTIDLLSRLACILALTIFFISPLSTEDFPIHFTAPTYLKLSALITTLVSLALAYPLTVFFWLGMKPRIPYLWADLDPPPDPLALPQDLYSAPKLIVHLTDMISEKSDPVPFFPFSLPRRPKQVLISQALLIKISAYPLLMELFLATVLS